MKRLLTLATILTILLLVSLGSFFWWRENSRPVSNNENFESFVIPKGYSASQIGVRLHEKGFIRSPFAFKVYSLVTGKSKKIQAGEYSLSPSLSVQEVVNQLVKGPREVWVTVPEGLRREEIAERFITGLSKDSDEAVIFREEFMDETMGQEGFLFPDTYLFPREATASQVASLMKQTFDRRIGELEEGIAESELSLEEIVTLASIIERETKTNEERPVVAGILINRLDIDMGLQADATVQYAIGQRNCTVGEKCNWWPKVTKENLNIDSPHNTYRYKGLPPGPIANPGLSSLRAAVFPEDSDYLYYLHEDNGQIHYARTLEEHNENVRRYLGK